MYVKQSTLKAELIGFESCRIADGDAMRVGDSGGHVWWIGFRVVLRRAIHPLLMGAMLVVGCEDQRGMGETEDRDGDGVSTAQGDCDDADPEVGPMAVDTVGDGIDQNCDDVDGIDADGDGVASRVSGGDDCDDGEPGLGASSQDGDCDGVLTADDCDDADEGMNRDDADGDGFSTCDEDCDDADPAVHPAAADVGVTDLNCDGRLSSMVYSFIGESSGDYSSYSVSGAGDVDGDGLSDVLIGARWNDAGGLDAGSVYLMFGASLNETPEIDLSQADVVFIGEQESDGAGWAVASAGDVDGDARADLLIGAPGNDDVGGNAGKAYLVLGASLGGTSTFDLAQADYSFGGEHPGDSAGGSVSSAGDVDGDGMSDLLIGAPYNGDRGEFAGKTYLVLGSSLGAPSHKELAHADYSFVGEAAHDHFGSSVSSAGDVDGDGLDDLLFGAPDSGEGGGSAGTTYLVFGSSLGAVSQIDLSQADYAFVGEDAGDYSGSSVSSAGDVDGDGLGDLLIGAYGNDERGESAGKAYLVLGASLGETRDMDLSLADYSFTGGNIDDYGGRAVSGAGDVDGDGLSDVLIGANGSDDGMGGAGQTYLVLGSRLGAVSHLELADADYGLVGENSGDESGWAVAGAGDVDGDGLSDLLIGAFENDDGGIDAGKTYLVWGARMRAESVIELSNGE